MVDHTTFPDHTRLAIKDGVARYAVTRVDDTHLIPHWDEFDWKIFDSLPFARKVAKRYGGATRIWKISSKGVVTETK